MLREPVAVTGLGAVSALGHGTRALWDALAEGRDGIRRIDRFSTEGLRVDTAALVPGVASDEADRLALTFAIEAAREAIASSGLADRPPRADRLALTFGTSLATHPEGIHRLAELVGDALGARGVRITVSTACASSADAVGLGRDLILGGLADVVLAGGADALTPLIFSGFHALGLLAPGKCAPFSEPRGTTLGEGAGFVVIESRARAEARGAKVLAFVSGSGRSCDAYHATSPDPSGAGVARAARAALDDAALAPADVDYVNAHGTGTEANDPAEWRGLLATLGERARSVPVSATKSAIGHAQGAAGVLELVAMILAMQHGAIPQTLHHVARRPRCPDDPVASSTPRRVAVAHALCDSSAFGGANAVLAIDAAHAPSPSRDVARAPVFIAGAGAIGAFGAGLDALSSAWAAGSLSGACPRPPLPPGVDPKTLDPLARLVASAVAAALGDAGLVVRGAMRDRSGLFATLERVSPSSAHELDRSVKERGLARLSAPAFTRVVLNAAPGAAARALELRGPTTTITTGAGSGLVALALAAEHLATRNDADAIVVAAADERDGDAEATSFEGAAAIALSRAPSSDAAVRVLGWALAGPGRVDDAAARALAMADVSSPRLAPAVRSAVCAPATAELLRVAVLLSLLRRGERAPILVTHSSGASAAAAIVIGFSEGGS